MPEIKWYVALSQIKILPDRLEIYLKKVSILYNNKVILQSENGWEFVNKIINDLKTKLLNKILKLV